MFDVNKALAGVALECGARDADHIGTFTHHNRELGPHVGAHSQFRVGHFKDRVDRPAFTVRRSAKTNHFAFQWLVTEG